jgi:hypothetical protein
MCSGGSINKDEEDEEDGDNGGDEDDVAYPTAASHFVLVTTSVATLLS